jgi:hypothetical protein
MPYIECHIAAGLTKTRKTQMIRDIVKVTHESIVRSQDHQCSSVRASRRKHEHFRKNSRRGFEVDCGKQAPELERGPRRQKGAGQAQYRALREASAIGPAKSRLRRARRLGFLERIERSI